MAAVAGLAAWILGDGAGIQGRWALDAEATEEGAPSVHRGNALRWTLHPSTRGLTLDIRGDGEFQLSVAEGVLSISQGAWSAHGNGYTLTRSSKEHEFLDDPVFDLTASVDAKVEADQLVLTSERHAFPIRLRRE